MPARSVAVACALLALGCVPPDRAGGRTFVEPDTASAPAEPILEPGFREHRTRGADRRDFWVYLPHSRAVDELLPLVFSIHGRGGHGFTESLRWIRLAEDHRLIVCCPASKGSHSGRVADYRADEAVYLEMLEQVLARYPADGRRVLITGFSGGALTAFWTGIRHAPLFAGLAVRSPSWPHSLAAETAALRRARTLPVLIAHGRKDHEFTLEDVGDAVKTLRAAGWSPIDLTVLTIEGGGHDGSASLPQIVEWFSRLPPRR